MVSNIQKKYVYSIGGSILVFIVLFLMFTYATSDTISNTNETTLSSTQQPKPTLNPFDMVVIEGKAAYVYDVATKKVLYEKNANLQLPLASLTKVMTALVASEIGSTTATIQIDPSFLNADGDSGLVANEKWNLRNLSDFSLVVSSNDGADAIAAVAGSMINNTQGNQTFIEKMNVEAKKLGLKQTYFLNGSGLDVNEAISGGYGSAKDVATLFEVVLKKDPHLLEATTYPEIRVQSKDQSHKATNTNKMVSVFPSVLASKTGFTDLAGGNLAVAFAVGPMHPVIAVVMNSTVDGRFKDMETLINTTVESMVSH